MENKVYKCRICNQMMLTLYPNEKRDYICCGASMEKLEAKYTEDLYSEKHIPVVKIKRNKVYIRVGESLHPTSEAHRILWIMLVTGSSIYIKYLSKDEEPVTSFTIQKDEEVKEVYSYCNIHSLYKLEIRKEEE